MSWKGVITNAGQQILSQWTANGHTLTIDGASVGSGYVDDINMRVATALAHEKATAAIVSADAVDGGTKFKVQVSPAESTEYVAHEIGLWGHIDDGPRTLIALHQDSQTGINIPTKASSPDFIFALYLVHAISNSDTLTVNIDTSAVVSKSTMDNAIATAVSDASKTLNDKIVSNSEAISTNTNNISKNTADITALNNGLAQLYPVGSIYLSVNDTNPSTFIGGTWERIKDRFLLAAGDSYAAGSTGGEATHKLSVNEMPSHSHVERLGDGSDPQNVNNLKRKQSNGKENGAWIEVTWRSSGLKEDVTTTLTGGSAAHNNMPPYIAVYMWVRTA